MKKEIKTVQLQRIATELLTVWDQDKSKIVVKGRTLYNLIGLKKEFERHLDQIQQTIAGLAERHGGELQQETGGFIIPPEHREALNKCMLDFGRETITIEATAIVITSDDEIPASIMDAIFDFVTFED
jgi:truncated hemoglobin YjbI